MWPANPTIAVSNLIVSFLMTQRKAKLDRDQLMEAALRALGGREHSTGELRDKLRRRGDAADVEAVLQKLRESGYLDDRRFATGYAAARLENNLGKMRVVRDLRQRRVAPELAEQIAEQTYSGTNETALIEEFLRRKYRGKKLAPFLAEPKNLAAAFRRLRYAGFSAGSAIAVLKRHAREPEILDALESEQSGDSED